MFGASSHDERVRWEEVRRLFDADLLHDIAHGFTEAVDRLLRLPDVDDAEPVLALPGSMEQEAIEGEVGDRLCAGLASASLRTTSSYFS